jgi:hypothetical protein
MLKVKEAARKCQCEAQNQEKQRGSENFSLLEIRPMVLSIGFSF